MPLPFNRQTMHGPFDIVGDVHGCYVELLELLEKLGYRVQAGNSQVRVAVPAGRTIVFVGDLADRGPRTPEVLRLAMHMSSEGTALSVPGNHDDKLLRALRGRNVQVKHGLEKSLAQLQDWPDDFCQAVINFISDMPSHLILDEGKLVVAHAGMRADLQGRQSERVRDFALYGATTGKTDALGLPERLNWAADYRGEALVVFGHTPVAEPLWLNNTVNIDTGCVFGGALTALRYPELELVSVRAHYTYSQPSRPFLPPEQQAPPAPAR